jgi:hypothetical protein
MIPLGLNEGIVAPPRGYCRRGVILLIQALACTLLLLRVDFVRAVDVTGATGVLAYTLLETCPVGWDDQATNEPYRGRLIKGWSRAALYEIGGRSAVAPSTTNDVFWHSHSKYALRIDVKSGAIGKPTYNNWTHSYVASDVNFISEANTVLSSSTARIPR